MADGVFNVAKGRVVELFRRVDANDPANSALIIVVLKETGLVEDSVLKDYETLEAVLAGASDEATNVGYARVTYTDSDIAFPAPDLVNDRYDIDIPDVKWTGVAEAGGKWAKLLVCYDNDTTGGTDANIIPCTYQDFKMSPDGSNLIAEINAAGFFRAS